MSTPASQFNNLEVSAKTMKFLFVNKHALLVLSHRFVSLFDPLSPSPESQHIKFKPSHKSLSSATNWEENRSLAACMPVTTHDVFKNLHCSWLLRLPARCLGLASDEVCLHSTEGFSEKELSLWGQSRGGGYQFPSRSHRGNGFRDGCHTDPFHCPTPPLISTNPSPLAFQSLNFSLPVPFSSFLPLIPPRTDTWK